MAELKPTASNLLGIVEEIETRTETRFHSPDFVAEEIDTEIRFFVGQRIFGSGAMHFGGKKREEYFIWRWSLNI